ncbi:MAG: dTMP kinase [Anaerohalosphaeraceae bacterium]|nr:dTMP kinase [Anaerohalosphaeraceae bacterium]
MFESKFIVLDGPDGCGKSTQARLLAEYIHLAGVEVALFRDPGSTVIGEKIREILLDTGNVAMSDRTELLLYMAARAQLYAECIVPALAQGKCVILDRWVSSTCAYQGFAGGVGVERVIDIAEHSLERVWPDVTAILDVGLETSASRMNRELDRMEQKGCDYHNKVRQGFLDFARQRKDVIIIDAHETIETVNANVIAGVEQFFKKL